MKQALADAIERRGYTTLTPVQEAVTNPETIGADLLVSAQTGSGKTLGFGLAIAPALLREAEVFDAAGVPLALVIAPTRELAMQVKRELAWLYADTGAVLASCVGGMDMRDERRSLERGAHIVVATPGRLRDHIMRGSIDLGQLRAVVLDEADEMLDLGFREDLEFILGSAPEDRQTLLFSATVPAAIAKLAQNYQKDAIRVATTTKESQHADIEYRALGVSARDGENAIINVLRYYEAPNAIVFCNTRAMVNRLTTRLSNRGFSVVALSGELSQNERTHALQAMRDGRARVCVATDVAARGIDLPNLDLVIHAELPTNHETLLHRSGRTGRAGRKGVSALIVPPAARKKAERLLGWAKLRAEWADAPSADEVTERDEERMLSDPEWAEEIPASQVATVEKLTERFSAEQIAAAFLRLRATQYSAPEDLLAIDAKPEPRVAFGPSVWFSIPGGRAENAEPRRLLPMLCKAGNLTKDDIGAIRIQQDASYVEIREKSVPGFLAAIGPDMKVEEGAVLTRLNTPPAFAAQSRAPSAGPRPERAPRPPQPPREAPVEAAPPPRAEPAPAPVPTPGTTVPTDWNDAPTPRPKKPKKQRPDAPAPHAKPRPDREEGDRAVSRYKGPPRSHEGKPAGRYEGKPAGRSEGKPAGRFEGKPAGRYEGKPEGRPDYKPRGKPEGREDAGRSSGYGKPAAYGKPGGKPGGKFEGRPDGKPGGFGKPGGKFAGKPGGKPGGKFAGKPGGKPGGKPAAKPAGTGGAPFKGASDPSQGGMRKPRKPKG